MRYLIPVLLIVLSACYTPLAERNTMEQHHWEMYRYYQTMESYSGTLSEGEHSKFYQRQATQHYHQYRQWKADD